MTILGGQPRLQEPWPHQQFSERKVIAQNSSIFDVWTLLAFVLNRAPDICEFTRNRGKAAGQSDRFRKFSWPILIISAAMTIGLVADLAFVDTPSFHTDLSDFAPDSESSDAHDRISEHFSKETRPMFVHVTRDDGKCTRYGFTN